MLEFRTAGFNGYSVKYSPFFDSRIAVAASSNFGLVGNGRLFVLGLTPQGIVAEKTFDTQDSLFDVAWSEDHENQLVTASGDGSIKLYDISLNEFPIQVWQEHAREVYCVSWNLREKGMFLSSSWDGTVRVWLPGRQSSLNTIPIHSCTYSAAFSPHNPSLISAVSSDSHLRLFNMRTPASASNHLVNTIRIHQPPSASPGTAPFAGVQPSEALTHDWNKYRDTIIATAGVDRIIRTFDIRAPNAGPVAILPGHDYAVRRVSWSPHLSDVLLSASYDMSVRVWSDGSAITGNFPVGGGSMHGGGREMGRMGRHSEFATGVDWCLFGAEGWCASCGWDERLLVWDVRSIMQK